MTNGQSRDTGNIGNKMHNEQNKKEKRNHNTDTSYEKDEQHRGYKINLTWYSPYIALFKYQINC